MQIVCASALRLLIWIAACQADLTLILGGSNVRSTSKITFPDSSNEPKQDLLSRSYTPATSANCSKNNVICDSVDNYPRDVITNLLKNMGIETATNLEPSKFKPNFKSRIGDSESVEDTSTFFSVERKRGPNDIEPSKNSETTTFMPNFKPRIGDMESGEKELCEVRYEEKAPQALIRVKDNELGFVVNQDSFRQVISVEICEIPEAPCKSLVEFRLGIQSYCKQRYMKMSLLSFDGQIKLEPFYIPSGCSCVYVD